MELAYVIMEWIKKDGGPLLRERLEIYEFLRNRQLEFPVEDV